MIKTTNLNIRIVADPSQTKLGIIRMELPYSPHWELISKCGGLSEIGGQLVTENGKWYIQDNLSSHRINYLSSVSNARMSEVMSFLDEFKTHLTRHIEIDKWLDAMRENQDQAKEKERANVG